MSTTDLFKQIVSEYKWYAPFMSVQQASRIKRLHHNGKHKTNFYVKFFAKFGYEQEEIKWGPDLKKLEKNIKKELNHRILQEMQREEDQMTDLLLNGYIPKLKGLI